MTAACSGRGGGVLRTGDQIAVGRRLRVAGCCRRSLLRSVEEARDEQFVEVVPVGGLKGCCRWVSMEQRSPAAISACRGSGRDHARAGLQFALMRRSVKNVCSIGRSVPSPRRLGVVDCGRHRRAAPARPGGRGLRLVGALIAEGPVDRHCPTVCDIDAGADTDQQLRRRRRHASESCSLGVTARRRRPRFSVRAAEGGGRARRRWHGTVRRRRLSVFGCGSSARRRSG